DRVCLAVGDAGGRGVDQAADAVRAAGMQHVVRAGHVGRVVALVAAPGPGLGGAVEHGIEAARRGQHRLAIGEVAADLAHAERLELRVLAAVEARHLVPTLDQAATQCLPEETAATADQDPHRLPPVFAAAHRASVSRPILALCRMSTGKRGWNSTVSMRAVCGWRAPMARSSRAMRACCAAPTPASASTHNTGCCASCAPTPTSAVRRTSGWTLNTGSTCSV